MQKSPYSDYRIVNIQQNFPKLSANVYVFKRCRPRGFVWSKSLSLHFLLKSKSWMYINNKENWCNLMLHMCRAQNHRPYSNTENTTIRRATLVRVERMNSILTGNKPPAGREGFLLGGAGWGEGDRTENTNASSKSKVLGLILKVERSLSPESKMRAGSIEEGLKAEDTSPTKRWKWQTTPHYTCRECEQLERVTTMRHKGDNVTKYNVPNTLVSIQQASHHACFSCFSFF